MLEVKNLYNSILVRGRRSVPTYDQVSKEAREMNTARVEANLYRSF